MTHEPGDEYMVELEVRRGPDGRYGVLIQEPNSWLFLPHSEDVRTLANGLLDSADELDAKNGDKTADPSATKEPKRVTFKRN